MFTKINDLNLQEFFSYPKPPACSAYYSMVAAGVLLGVKEVKT
jgi:hypothetical protein